ncbi:hypothetical protein RDI58_010486 [Solanum bulbocastanum]|uniref:Uncharacterized protein n=1 Tax=Solanum bulbocastanum TaxID=147425 RepID=A0AAN8TPD9_SOLBU
MAQAIQLMRNLPFKRSLQRHHIVYTATLDRQTSLSSRISMILSTSFSEKMDKRMSLEGFGYLITGATLLREIFDIWKNAN